MSSCSTHSTPSGKEHCASKDFLWTNCLEESRKWQRGEHPSELERFGGTYLAQDSEAWFRVQFWLFQLHHSHPAVFVQVLFVIVITQAQWVHLGNKRQRKCQYTGCRYDGVTLCISQAPQSKVTPKLKFKWQAGGGGRIFQPTGNPISLNELSTGEKTTTTTFYGCFLTVLYISGHPRWTPPSGI